MSSGDFLIQLVSPKWWEASWNGVPLPYACKPQSDGTYLIQTSQFPDSLCDLAVVYIENGSIEIINSNTDPLGDPTDQKFTYSLANANGESVPLDRSELGDGEETTAEVPTNEGPYTITKTPTEGWTLTVSGEGCTQDGNTVTAAVTKDQTTECTFTNTRDTGVLTMSNSIVGNVDPNSQWIYEVRDSDDAVVWEPSFGAQKPESEEFYTGEYKIRAVNIPVGWTLRVVSGENCGTLNPDDNSVTINLAPAGVECIFIYQGDSSLKITNFVTDASGPSDQKFTYSLANAQGQSVPLNPSELGNGMSTIAAVSAVEGPYTITQDLVEGWTLTVSGDGCTQDGNTVTAAVTKDQTTECTFTNTRDTGVLTMSNSTIGNVDPNSQWAYEVRDSDDEVVWKPSFGAQEPKR
ncbi:MAG: hypothetical protein GY877_08150 [Hyphomicrobium sp.]|nr:hypothetical protein [Hyphomicrobium sp.]